MKRKAFRFDWFGWNTSATLRGGGPRWFVTRGANFLYVSLGGFAAVTLPWPWSRAALENRGYERGWNMGYESGLIHGAEREKGGDR